MQNVAEYGQHEPNLPKEPWMPPTLYTIWIILTSVLATEIVTQIHGTNMGSHYQENQDLITRQKSRLHQKQQQPKKPHLQVNK